MRERRIAILVPLWHEHAVIGRMLEHNLAAIRYARYDFFVGVYPNDELTCRAVAEIARRRDHVHLCTVPHPGPTSKGDCLNAIFDAMRDYEARNGLRYEVIITHDAEDMIHPEALRLINWYSYSHAMVQVPVLPLPTRFGEVTHGLYCDEFAEYQSKDIPVRQMLGGFLPSNGVGTGFSRDALEELAAKRDGRIFEPECLTEDYENGFCLHQMGFRQIFVPLRFETQGPVATREYFPRNIRAAIRQRSRWVAGIVLQGWERHGWRVDDEQLYWLWRDRKGLVGNLLSPLLNVLLPWGLWVTVSRGVENALPEWLARACAVNAVVTLIQMGARGFYSGRIYGWGFALGVPLRTFWGNWINCIATLLALWQYTVARICGRSLAWRKTEHKYAVAAAPTPNRPRLGELLVRMQCLSAAEVDEALKVCPAGTRLGEHLVELRKLSEQRLYEALSSQASLPLGIPEGKVDHLATQSLPADAIRRWKVLPYRIAAGQMMVATPEIPSEKSHRELQELSRLDLRFRLMPKSEFEALVREHVGVE
jgi:adsorption protein B